MLDWGVQSSSETASESLNDDFSYDSSSEVIIQTIYNLSLAHHQLFLQRTTVQFHPKFALGLQPNGTGLALHHLAEASVPSVDCIHLVQPVLHPVGLNKLLNRSFQWFGFIALHRPNLHL